MKVKKNKTVQNDAIIKINQFSEVINEPGLQSTIDDILYTAVYGDDYMLAQIAAGGVDKRISPRKADIYSILFQETINSIDPSTLSGSFWGYKFYENQKYPHAFYVLPVRGTPYGLVVSVKITSIDQRIGIAYVITAIIYSVENIERILRERDVTITHGEDFMYKYCRSDNPKHGLERLYELRQRRLRRERLLERRLRYLKRLEYLERLRRLRRLYGS